MHVTTMQRTYSSEPDSFVYGDTDDRLTVHIWTLSTSVIAT
jgi:hypothetical protein